jgi:hypothetical protein
VALRLQTYLISDGRSVKIGKSGNASKRQATLQTACADPLRILLLLDGDHERELHERFASSRKRGEWFELSDDIQRFIRETQSLPWFPPFYTWILEQKKRVDDIGRFAVLVASDKRFPKRANRLNVFLKYYDQRRTDLPTAQREWQRRCVKRAHNEWRKSVGSRNAAQQSRDLFGGVA